MVISWHAPPHTECSRQVRLLEIYLLFPSLPGIVCCVLSAFLFSLPVSEMLPVHEAQLSAMAPQFICYFQYF